MAVPPPRYTAPQRAAARRALAEGVRPVEVARRAAAGELVDGLEPFHLPPATARTWMGVQKRRAKREADQAAAEVDPAAAVAQLRGELIAAIRAELRDVKRRQTGATGKRERVAGTELQQLGRALREVVALLPGATAPRSHSEPGGSAPSREPVPGIAGAILTEHRRRVDTAHTYRAGSETAQPDQPPGSEAPDVHTAATDTADQQASAPGSSAHAATAG